MAPLYSLVDNLRMENGWRQKEGAIYGLGTLKLGELR